MWTFEAASFFFFLLNFLSIQFTDIAAGYFPIQSFSSLHYWTLISQYHFRLHISLGSYFSTSSPCLPAQSVGPWQSCFYLNRFSVAPTMCEDHKRQHHFLLILPGPPRSNITLSLWILPDSLPLCRIYCFLFEFPWYFLKPP